MTRELTRGFTVSLSVGHPHRNNRQEDTGDCFSKFSNRERKGGRGREPRPKQQNKNKTKSPKQTNPNPTPLPFLSSPASRCYRPAIALCWAPGQPGGSQGSAAAARPHPAAGSPPSAAAAAAPRLPSAFPRAVSRGRGAGAGRSLSRPQKPPAGPASAQRPVVPPPPRCCPCQPAGGRWRPRGARRCRPWSRSWRPPRCRRPPSNGKRAARPVLSLPGRRGRSGHGRSQWGSLVRGMGNSAQWLKMNSLHFKITLHNKT